MFHSKYKNTKQIKTYFVKNVFANRTRHEEQTYKVKREQYIFSPQCKY